MGEQNFDWEGAIDDVQDNPYDDVTADQLKSYITTLCEKRERQQYALEWLRDYEKDPPEICKDDFAYDRLLAYVKQVARVGLGEIENTNAAALSDQEEEEAREK